MAQPPGAADRSKATRDVSTPTIALVAVTDEAQLALGGRTRVEITQFPFRVGRESRSSGTLRSLVQEVERRLRGTVPLNDLYLTEPESLIGFYISREHFTIERADEGFVLVDRQSSCGTVVGGAMLKHEGTVIRNVGSNRLGGYTELHTDDLIVVGGNNSPYVFRFQVS